MTRVMIADDNRDILESTKVLLEMLEYEVEVVQKASQIVDRIQAMKPDLLLQDFHMPELDVANLIADIRKIDGFRTLPVILFTASIENEHLWKAVGADGLIFKPFDVTTVKATIETYLDAQRA